MLRMTRALIVLILPVLLGITAPLKAKEKEDDIQSSLADLDKRKIKYRIEGFMWHQGENDMFNKDYMPNYGILGQLEHGVNYANTASRR